MIKASLYTFSLLCLPLVGAQYGGGGSSTTTTATTSSTASSTASGSASATQSVNVGQNGFTYTPDTIHVPKGGVVEFHFYPGDHSVVEAAFNNPCHPLSDTSFFSGFMANANNGKPVWSLTVNDTNPIWFYCGQVGHCAAGMVGVINPSGSDTLNAFKSAASNANGQSVPATVQGGILGTPSASQTSTASSSTASSSTASSSTSATSGTQTTTGGSSPSATNTAANLHVSIDLSVLSILTLTMAMILM
ncbi:uncharacterized protein N7458_001728 [Penicillium daleae]|uniref:Extracellular serine-rich protein n=1 Tax=Penicillium daleae TaxID=63821 RepID=A0AAD6G5K7_9EURO|nr:uncharacterized protein N7458_001728 [Penicillium daleae]KAJ5460176.1 hypothetical protein N7458_001728 [Penicillium daleae]